MTYEPVSHCAREPDWDCTTDFAQTRPNLEDTMSWKLIQLFHEASRGYPSYAFLVTLQCAVYNTLLDCGSFDPHVWDAAAARITFTKLKESLQHAINSVFLVLIVVSVYNSVTGTREIVPYKDIPNGLGENAERVQDWIAHFFFAYFCAEGDTAFILKLLECGMRSSHKATVQLFKQECSHSSWIALVETLLLWSSYSRADMPIHGDLYKAISQSLKRVCVSD
jgi:hypothetical protein